MEEFKAKMIDIEFKISVVVVVTSVGSFATPRISACQAHGVRRCGMFRDVQQVTCGFDEQKWEVTFKFGKLAELWTITIFNR